MAFFRSQVYIELKRFNVLPPLPFPEFTDIFSLPVTDTSISSSIQFSYPFLQPTLGLALFICHSVYATVTLSVCLTVRLSVCLVRMGERNASQNARRPAGQRLAKRKAFLIRMSGEECDLLSNRPFSCLVGQLDSCLTGWTRYIWIDMKQRRRRRRRRKRF